MTVMLYIRSLSILHNYNLYPLAKVSPFPPPTQLLVITSLPSASVYLTFYVSHISEMI